MRVVWVVCVRVVWVVWVVRVVRGVVRGVLLRARVQRGARCAPAACRPLAGATRRGVDRRPRAGRC